MEALEFVKGELSLEEAIAGEGEGNVQIFLELGNERTVMGVAERGSAPVFAYVPVGLGAGFGVGKRMQPGMREALVITSVLGVVNLLVITGLLMWNAGRVITDRAQRMDLSLFPMHHVSITSRRTLGRRDCDLSHSRRPVEIRGLLK